MKKAKDEMRGEYKRSDFKKLERGTFYLPISRIVGARLNSYTHCWASTWN